MRILAHVLVLTLFLAISFGAQSASAQGEQPQFVRGGGLIRGAVYGFTMYDDLTPIGWAPVTAQSDEYSFVAYTGGNGIFEMFVPSGVYNVTVDTPGYKAYSMNVAVSDGSSSNLNFYLEQSGVPIPEFEPQTLSMMLLVALASVLLARRATRRRRA